MTFSLELWQEQTRQKLRQTGKWLERVKQSQAPYVLYGLLSTMTVWPLLEALGAGQVFPVMNALGIIAGSVGGNLIATKLDTWKQQADQLSEPELEQVVSQDLAADPDLRAAIDSLIEKLEVVPPAYEGLNEADQAWFAATLQQELAQLGSLQRLAASLTGAEIIIQDSHLQGGDRSAVGSYATGHIITGDYNRVADTIIEQQTIVQETPGPDPTALREAYLSRLLENCSHLSLAGIDPKAASSSETEARLNLSAVYTALLTTSTAVRQPADKSGLATHDTRQLSALEELNRCRQLVLLGDPGSGKTTFVNFVTICLVGEALGHNQVNLALLTAPLPDDEGQDREEPQPWLHGALLPVRVILRDFAARGLPATGEPATAQHLWRFIEADLKSATLGDFAPLLVRELLEKGGLLLLDGLDEVPEARQKRVQLKQAIEDFAKTFRRCRILVTSRTYAYQKQDWRLPKFEEAVLASFSAGQIRRFVERWYAHIAVLRGLATADAQGRAALLEQAIFGSDRLQGLAERPLLLTLMASLHAWRSGSLPEKREELYADTVELLLDTWETRKVQRDAGGNIIAVEPSLTEWLRVDRDAVRSLLNRLAYQAHAEQPEIMGTADVPEDELVGGLLRLSPKRDLRPGYLVDYLSQRAGLLLPRGEGIYTFPHRTFQEYLAACHLTDADYPDQVAKLARTEPERWREVALLAGAKAARGTASAVWSLVDALCYRGPDNADCDELDPWGAQLAGQLLVESGVQSPVSERNQAKVERVRGWLVQILNRAALPPTERAIAGRNLAGLGDPRLGVGLRADGLPDIEWCEVPAGPFMRGSQDDRLKFFGKETPQQKIKLPAFEIGRYPVTNVQYAAFVEDGGYTDKWRQCWTEAGWQWKGDRTRPDKAGGVFDQPNHPVVMVSWYEVVAFCRWLTIRLQASGELKNDQEISLPSENQWEKAARGSDGRVYPWGNQADPDRANYRDTGLGSTSAVGCFPGGTGPYGVQDMSGNVWEWCRTKFGESYENYQDDNRLEGNAPRVLRGGAFSNDVQYVRCAVRSRYDPYYGGDIGFRVVVSPFFSNSGL